MSARLRESYATLERRVEERTAELTASLAENARLLTELEARTAELEIANRHKSAFLAGMSHELRTPLNAIIGFSEVMRAGLAGEISERQAEYLTDIHDSGRHLLDLINDILDMSKIEAGRMELEPAPVDMALAAEQAIAMVRERASLHGIQIALHADLELPTIEADERKVRQILLNLLSNAVKFTPDGGSVSVGVGALDGGVEATVTDTGVGIDPADHEAIFEDFRQVGAGAARGEGTGLGLGLARRLAELHGGTLDVASAPGAGSTFTVRLPTRPPSARGGT